MIPEKSAADGGENDRPGEEEAGRERDFPVELRALYEAAGGGEELGLKQLISLGKPHFKVTTSSLSDWFRGKSVPREPKSVSYVLDVLIPFLEATAAQRSPGHRPTGKDTWRARLVAAQSVKRSGQGGRGPRVNESSPGRLFGVPSQALHDVLPHEFVGREEELAALQTFATARDHTPAYMSWEADAWAGKTALLAWFADRCLPAGVDAVHYFIAGRLGTNHREDFVMTLGEQLASVANRKLRAAEFRRLDLTALYEEAARTSAARHRRLLLIVDGLDEDADAGPGRKSIAALLPKQPPHGMRVIVSARRSPQIPPDVADDHPLRDPGILRRLTASPAAQVIRERSLRELDALLDDPLVGRRLLGLLVVARGALTGTDMAELVDITPYDVQKKLRTVVGRNMAPTDIDRLAMGAQADADAAAGRHTFVLAHSDLYEAATEALGKTALAASQESLHTWADGYRDRGWPPDTPNYLLTGYTRLIQHSKEADRLAELALDPQRQLRLVQRSGPDVALADLALVASRETGLSTPGLVTAAAVAVSREMLLPYTRRMPRSIARTIARRGDVRRARALAGAPSQPSAKAVHLADVALVLAEAGHQEAEMTASEAGEWARTALRRAGPAEYARDEAEAAAGQAALALLATNQVENGLGLLRSTRGTATARYEAWAEASRLLAPHHPKSAAGLLDELEEQAANLAEELGEGSSMAVQLWAMVAASAPDRADRLYDRLVEHAREVWAVAPVLENVMVLATAASALAQARPDAASHLADTALRYLRSMLQDTISSLSAADSSYREFGVRQALAGLRQAFSDLAKPTEEIRRLLGPVEEALPTGPDYASSQPGHDDEEEAASKAKELADEALRLTGLGRDSEANRCLDEALSLLPPAGSLTDRAPLWLPDLAGALVRINAPEDAEALLGLWGDPADRARTHAAMASAYMDLGSLRDARRYALQAADTAGDAWPHAAHALACTGDVEAALDLIRRHGTPPVDRSKRAEWRKADREARIAVAVGLSTHDPEASSRLLFPFLDALEAGRRAPRGEAALLGRLAEFLPAGPGAGRQYEARLQELGDAGLAYADKSGPETWQPETVLVHALLRIGAGEDPGTQLDWLTRDMTIRGCEHFPTTALAVVHAARGDVVAAQEVAGRLTDSRTRGAALTAVAGHLARVPVRPVFGAGQGHLDSFTRAVQSLALSVTSHASGDRQAAARLLQQGLETAGWYHALSALAQIEPAAITCVRDIAAAHVHAREAVPDRGR
ncbi:hypothetical protein ACGFY6_33030 [Streptomyces sp. NPDC048387]|uniref:hypothetical protein n=1 Tax=Streptomyces sp. NPDC048387 TaxID=3365542 RepID=UPI003714BAC0